MGLWIKNDDGSIEKVAGSGGGGGGTFDGEHVLTGDVDNPPEELTVGQLMWDGVEGGSGGGGPHDHDDYLPLVGGTLTGGLTVDKSLTLTSEASNPLMVVNRAGTRVGYFGVPGAQAGENGELHLRGDKELMLQGIDGVRTLQCGLTVDTNLQVDGDANFGPSENFKVFKNGTVRSSAIANLTTTFAPNVFINPANNSIYRSTWTPSRMAFAPSKLTRDSDVLDRAETATLPPEPETDEDGNQTNTAEVKAHDTVELFDVVTALLAKVKELSDRIEELEGN